MGGQIHLQVSGWHAECGGMGNVACGMRHTSASMKLQTDVKPTLCVIIIYVLPLDADPISNPNFNLNLNSTQPSTNGSPAQHCPAPVNLKSNVT